VSFTLYLVSHATRARRLPREEDVRRLFEGFIQDDDGQVLTVGIDEVSWCEVYYEADPGSELVRDINVDRPTDIPILWTGLYRLLKDYDLVMFMTSGEPELVAGHADVPLPDGMQGPPFVVSSADELRSIVGE
jgi:hypothetical protein